MENDLDTPDSLHHADHVAELPQSGERTRGVANARAVLVYLVAMVACTAQLPPASAAPAVARDIDPSGSPAGRHGRQRYRPAPGSTSPTPRRLHTKFQTQAVSPSLTGSAARFIPASL